MSHQTCVNRAALWIAWLSPRCARRGGRRSGSPLDRSLALAAQFRLLLKMPVSRKLSLER